MANTYVDYTGDGSTQTFNFSFDYLDASHVKVELDGVATTAFTVQTSPRSVLMTTAPTSGVVVRVHRDSDSATKLVDFVDGSVLVENDLDKAYLHNLYLNEEIGELNDSSMQKTEGDTTWNAGGSRIINVGTPTATTDAATKEYIDDKVALSSTNLTGFNKSTHTGDGSLTAFTLSFTPQTTDAKAFIVSIDGVLQVPDTAYTLSGSTITFTSAPPNSSTICVVATAAASTTSAETAQVTATGSTQARALNDRFADVVNVKDFGAGDGTTDDATAIQAAINSISSGVVIIPNGTYNLTDTIDMKSNVSVQCDEGTVINGNTISSSSSPVVKFAGSVGTEYNLSVQADENDDRITIASGSFSVGDLVHIVSVRNCLNRTDAGGQWLGDGTEGAPYAYFAEFAIIAEDLGSSQYRISRPLIFDSYKINATGETETERTASTVKKVTPLENSKWIGGKIQRTSTGNDVFRMEWSYNSSVEKCHIVREDALGNSVFIAASYLCEAKDVTNTNDPKLEFNYAAEGYCTIDGSVSTHTSQRSCEDASGTWTETKAALHGKMNRFKTVGSMDCGFNGLKESYGAQSVDFTYGAGFEFSNVRSYCRGGSFTRCFEGLTSHAGCFQEEWTNNSIIDCLDDGILVRGYMPVISHNVITSTISNANAGDTNQNVCSLSQHTNEYDCETDGGIWPHRPYGISVQYGGPRRCTISNNTIRNFYGAVRVVGSSTEEWHYDNVLINISDNEISHCFLGLETVFSNDTVKDAVRFIQYKGNNHSYMGRYIVKLDEYSAGTSVVNNTFSGGFRYSGVGSFVAFVYGTESPMVTVQGNTWIRTKNANSSYTSYMVFLGSITDTTTYPEADWSNQTFIEDNFVTFETTDNVQTVAGSASYPNLAYGQPDQLADINGGVIKVLPTKHRVTYCQVDTESDAASDDLDTISAYDNNAFKEGDVLHLRSTTSAKNIVLKDQTGNIHTPNNADLTLDLSSSVVSLVYSGSNWSVVSADPLS